LLPRIATRCPLMAIPAPLMPPLKAITFFSLAGRPPMVLSLPVTVMPVVPFPRSSVSFASIPMWLPRTRLSEPPRAIPGWATAPAITLPSPAPVPPIVWPLPPVTMPLWSTPSFAVPETSVPITFPVAVWPVPEKVIPFPTPAIALSVAKEPVPKKEIPVDVSLHAGVSTASPAAVRPMRLPTTEWPLGEPALTIPTPVWQPEIRLRAAGAAPPMVAPVSPVISTCLLGSWSTRAVPAALVPRKQPSTRLLSNPPVMNAIRRRSARRRAP
jgi:hypothetical protein